MNLNIVHENYYICLLNSEKLGPAELQLTERLRNTPVTDFTPVEQQQLAEIADRIRTINRRKAGVEF